MKTLNFPFILLLLGMSSCATVRHTETAKALPIYGPGVLQLPTLVDLDIQNEMVQGSYTGPSNVSEAVIRAQAVSEAIKLAKVDVLVEPIFELERHGNQVTATVRGFPARYVNFRKATQEDIPVLETGVLQQASTAEVTTPAPTRRRKGGGGWVAAFLAIGLVLVLIPKGGR